MKNGSILLLCITLLTSACFAQANRPCLNIAAACENAGYRINNTTGMDIWKNCVKPIMSGQSVAGVAANQSDIQACKERKAQRKMMRMQHNNSMTPTTSPTPTVAPINSNPTPPSLPTY